MNIANQARKTLIRMGKILPFLVCGIVLISYIETIYALIFNNIIEYDDSYRLYKPISFWIASLFEYDVLVVLLLLIISISIQACVWNFLATFYLSVNLGFRAYIANMELTEISIYIFSIVNVIITSIIVIKGIKRMF